MAEAVLYNANRASLIRRREIVVFIHLRLAMNLNAMIRNPNLLSWPPLGPDSLTGVSEGEERTTSQSGVVGR